MTDMVLTSEKVRVSLTLSVSKYHIGPRTQHIAPRRERVARGVARGAVAPTRGDDPHAIVVEMRARSSARGRRARAPQNR